MTKVLELRFLSKDDRAFFQGKYHNQFRPGTAVRDGEIPGLEMTYDRVAGVVNLDAPGDSTVIHISRVAPKLEAAIPVQTFVAKPAPAPFAPKGNPKRAATKSEEEIAAQLGFDMNGDDLDDAEIAKLLQGSGAKKALKKKAAKKKASKKPAPKKAPPAASPPDDDENGDSQDDDIEDNQDDEADE